MEIDFKDPKYYTNRELSWVLFDYGENGPLGS